MADVLRCGRSSPGPKASEQPFDTPELVRKNVKKWCLAVRASGVIEITFKFKSGDCQWYSANTGKKNLGHGEFAEDTRSD